VADKRADQNIRPSLYTIAPHRGFADALTAGLVARYRKYHHGLSRLTMLVPNQRAVRAISEAFVRQSDGGLILPKMVAIGDLDLDESIGASLDSLEDDAAIAPAVDAVHRQFALARLVREYAQRNNMQHSRPEIFRLAREFGTLLDQLFVEQRDLADLNDVVAEHQDDLASHWQDSLKMVQYVGQGWLQYLQDNGLIDAVSRRNALLANAAHNLRKMGEGRDIMAAGITTPAPAVAGLLKSIAFSANGSVVFPGLDLALEEDVWEGLFAARMDGDDIVYDDFSNGEINHPQYHMRLLLHRMDVRRDEVSHWHRSGDNAAPPVTSRTISHIFLPAHFSGTWQNLPAPERRLPNVRLVETETLGEEAQAIALIARKALETPEKRIAIITPDRLLARRIANHLQRWGIEADDSAGRGLCDTPPATLLLGIAQCLASDFSATDLLSVLKHPLVRGDIERKDWLTQIRAMDMALRGPRLGLGLDAIAKKIEEYTAARQSRPKKGREDGDENSPRNLPKVWQQIHEQFFQAVAAMANEEQSLAMCLRKLAECANALTNGDIWKGTAGRALSDRLRALDEQLLQNDVSCAVMELPALLRGFLQDIAVRPAYGQHPRIAIYGLLEARLQRADIMICAGLNAGTWPQKSKGDPFLAPVVRRKLGMPTLDYSNGLSAHDLASALGAPECVLVRSKKTMSEVTIASPFLQRIKAVLDSRLQRDDDILTMARMLDRYKPQVTISAPAPEPSAEQRQVAISATDMDRLRGIPFAFYAGKIMNLRSLDPPDAPPSAAWRGTMVHDVLEQWVKEDGGIRAKLAPRVEAFWSAQGNFPLLQAFWRPRLDDAIAWIGEETDALAAQGRHILFAEEWGRMDYRGIALSGKADRVDIDAEGNLIIIDYKTGNPPSAAMVAKGYAMQMGVLSIIAEEGGFPGDKTKVGRVEYWSLARNKEKTGFGKRQAPIKDPGKKTGLLWDDFLPEMRNYLNEALDRWILGDEPFTAEANPDYKGYNDYDHLMRLEEWSGRAVLVSGAKESAGNG
jgi:ATP-dependent helicase/nuclease subunit B